MKKLSYRHVDWSKDRPRLFDLLREVEINRDELAGIILWREHKPYLLTAARAAAAALRLDAVCKAEGLTAGEYHRAIGALAQQFKDCNQMLAEVLEGPPEPEIIEEQTDRDPYDIDERLTFCILDAGLQKAEKAAVLQFICNKFRDVDKRLRREMKRYGIIEVEK